MMRAVFCVILLAAGALRAETVRVDGKGAGRTFEGIGAVSAGASTRLLIDYPEPQRSQILDFLFKPNFGASLQHLKVEIGGDMNSTDGSEPSIAHSRAEMANPNFHRGYEWWLMKEARKRNPKIYLDVLPWGAPGWIGAGKYYSPEMADYVVAFIQGARKAHKLDIDYAGVWNEKLHDSEWVKLLKQRLTAAGLATKVVCCDEMAHQDPWSLVAEMQKDPALKQAIDAITVHYTEIDTKDVPHPVTVPQAVIDFGKPLWASEDHPPRAIWRDPRENDWPRGSDLGKLYNENYIVRRYTKTEPWAVVTSYYDVLRAPNSGLMYAATPWSGHFRVQSTVWTTAAHHAVRAARLVLYRSGMRRPPGQGKLRHAQVAERQGLQHRRRNRGGHRQTDRQPSKWRAASRKAWCTSGARTSAACSSAWPISHPRTGRSALRSIPRRSIR